MFLQKFIALFDIPASAVKKGDVISVVTETTFNALKTTEGQEKLKEVTKFAGKNLNQMASYLKQVDIKNVN